MYSKGYKLNLISIGEDVEKLKPLCVTDGNLKVFSIMETGW